MGKKYIWVLVAIVVAGGSYYWYKKTHSTGTTAQYVTSTAQKGTLTVSVSGSGNVIVDQSSNIDPTITGTVADLAVNVGDSVRKGQLLFNIINNDLAVGVSRASSSLQSAENSIDSAKVSVKQAKADYDAAKQKDDSDGSSYTTQQLEVLRKKIDIARDGVTAAQKSYQATLADYNNQRSDASKRIVTSPIDGTVNEVNVKNGDDLSKLSSGSSRQVPIIIGDLGTLKAQVEINEVDISNVSIGQGVMMTFSAIDGLSASGKVEKMDSLGTLSSGVVSYNVTIGFDALDPRIKPEMSVSAAIITDVKQDVLVVPNGAIKTESGKNYVEVLNSDQNPQRKVVVTGASNSTETQIISGVSAGDKVITQTITSGTSTTKSSSGSSARMPGMGGFH